MVVVKSSKDEIKNKLDCQINSFHSYLLAKTKDVKTEISEWELTQIDIIRNWWKCYKEEE